MGDFILKKSTMEFTSKNINVELLELNKGQVEGLPKNPRFIKDNRFKALIKSIEDAPEMLCLRELLVYPHDGKYVVIGGNMRLRACIEMGYKEIPCKVLDADTPVEKLREYVIKDNNGFGQDDWDILANEWDESELTDWGMELPLWGEPGTEGGGEEGESRDEGERPENPYSTNVNSPIYEPTGECPEIGDIVKDGKVEQLLKEIEASSVTEEEKRVLRICAYRHAVINFSLMAEYYAHAGKEMQQLMENNALVIIDYDKAVENGFVDLCGDLQKIYDKN